MPTRETTRWIGRGDRARGFAGLHLDAQLVLAVRGRARRLEQRVGDLDVVGGAGQPDREGRLDRRLAVEGEPQGDRGGGRELDQAGRGIGGLARLVGVSPRPAGRRRRRPPPPRGLAEARDPLGLPGADRHLRRPSRHRGPAGEDLDFHDPRPIGRVADVEEELLGGHERPDQDFLQRRARRRGARRSGSAPARPSPGPPRPGASAGRPAR